MLKTKKRIIAVICAAAAVFAAAAAFFAADYYNLLPQKAYSDSDFGIETVKSGSDFNGNGTDDYTDIMLGARADALNRPKYDGSYFAGGYPSDGTGVCTDVIWRAFKNAGFSLRDMVDADIRKRPEAYTRIAEPDSNIDFRRVYNLHVFFEEYAQSLTADTNEISEFQPGDIVIFGKDKHIGIVSDRRNKKGRPYIIHNGGQPVREEDYLKRDTVTAHYRFDAALVPDGILKEWRGQAE